MLINCQLDTTITTGIQPFTCDFTQLTAIQNSTGDTYYLENNFTYGEVAICLFLIIIICMLITKWVADFFQAPLVRIRRKD